MPATFAVCVLLWCSCCLYNQEWWSEQKNTTQHLALCRRFPSRPVAQGAGSETSSVARFPPSPWEEAGQFMHLGIHTHKHMYSTSWPEAMPGFQEDFAQRAPLMLLAMGGEWEQANGKLMRLKCFCFPELAERAGASGEGRKPAPREQGGTEPCTCVWRACFSHRG